VRRPARGREFPDQPAIAFDLPSLVTGHHQVTPRLSPTATRPGRPPKKPSDCSRPRTRLQYRHASSTTSFVLRYFQNRSGTSTNHQANEVHATAPRELLGCDSSFKAHPSNDDVTLASSSTLDPDAINRPTGKRQEVLIPAIHRLRNVPWTKKIKEFCRIIRSNPPPGRRRRFRCVRSFQGYVGRWIGRSSAFRGKSGAPGSPLAATPGRHTASLCPQIPRARLRHITSALASVCTRRRTTSIAQATSTTSSRPAAVPRWRCRRSRLPRRALAGHRSARGHGELDVPAVHTWYVIMPCQGQPGPSSPIADARCARMVIGSTTWARPGVPSRSALRAERDAPLANAQSITRSLHWQAARTSPTTPSPSCKPTPPRGGPDRVESGRCC